MKPSTVIVLLSVVLVGSASGQEPWSLVSPADWTQAEASVKNMSSGTIALKAAGEGQWTSKWHDWGSTVDSAKVFVEAEFDLFDNKTIETVVKGSEKPYTDANDVQHDWYGRCMIAVVDENRWIMALRSGVNHIDWKGGDTIHLLTSSDEGRTWGKLDQWFDGTPIEGMPYYDGKCHSEPGLFRMPNGDFILQFWRTDYHTGTKQLRSTDNGKTWITDIERINVAGVTGAPGNVALGCQDWFVDPENPSDVYMAFEYYKYNSQSGCFLARSRDNGKSYTFLSWIGPLGSMENVDSGATFEPAIEYVGNRTIVAVLRGGAGGDRYTWQTVSTDMGISFRPPVEITEKINGGVPNGLWQRARLYKESNPSFQYNNQLNYAAGEGRLWGFGLHQLGPGYAYTRKPVVYWSDDNGESWCGPELLHGPMRPGTDTGYGDLKRRIDGTFVAATYYCQPGNESTVADVEQYTFGGESVKMMIEADRDGDEKPDADSGWRELYNGAETFSVSGLGASRWRLKLLLRAADPATSPNISRVKIIPR